MINPTLYIPQTAMIVGDCGAGKSFFLYHHPAIWEGKKTVIVDMEDRWEQMIEVKRLKKLPVGVEMFVPKEITSDGSIDYVKTFDNLVNLVASMSKKKPELIIFDGVSDLKTFCHEVWCVNNGRKHAINPFEWGQINQMVRQVVLNLIMLTRKNKTKIWFSALLVENYDEEKSPETNELGGLKIDLKRTVRANLDEVGILYKENGQYIYSRLARLGAKSWNPDEEYDITVEKEEVTE